MATFPENRMTFILQSLDYADEGAFTSADCHKIACHCLIKLSLDDLSSLIADAQRQYSYKLARQEEKCNGA